ncbi:MAG: NAD(P)-dependent oxidoreductase, partial [Ramlibacter sp.]|nr:NAD(P)-dependent oxidoreductase [Ramlibacter sp.]
MRRVAMVGVGNMGGAMCRRILDARWPVQIFDLDSAKMTALQAEGAVPRGDAAQVVVGCGVLIVCVVDAFQTEQVLFGANGAAAAMRAGQSVVLCPTISPSDVERFAARLSERGITVVDAPMSGGPVRARDGTMSPVDACEDAVFEKQRTLLEILSGKIFRISQKPGDGAKTKLV